MTASEFVAKWQAVTASEHAVAQTHFNELCDLLDVPKPLEADPTGESYAFERSVRKAARGKGFADVWKRGAFAWEYKTRGKDLGDAYRQLLLYRDDLGNPPLLVVCDIDRIEVHTNFTGTTKAVHTFTLNDLLDGAKRADLRSVWTHPASFNPQERRERITEEATKDIGRIALTLRDRGHEPQRVAHFLMQVVFALFAEDVHLLPNRLVSRILERDEAPERVARYLTDLFDAMGTGGDFALEEIAHFNGGLFDGTPALPLTQDEVRHLHAAAQLDWSDVEPAIFGTLFERSLDPAKRSQLGAHYTSRSDILRIVEPVVMQPLRRRWSEVREAAEPFLANPPTNPSTASKRRKAVVDVPLAEFLRELHSVRVLDPACGSGNFLYVALQTLKDLEHEVVTFAEQVGAAGFRLVGPRQFLGIELNLFARELASMVVWIGYLQWNRANGISNAQRPILEPLENIRLHDALLNEDGTEHKWPQAEFIIGNPPFLGDRKMRRELGDAYVDCLRSLYGARLPGAANLVCYWFEKARASVEEGLSRRAGFVATNSIRTGKDRVVLDRIKMSGDIFFARSEQKWTLDGADLWVSMIGFDNGTELLRRLDDVRVDAISAGLTSSVDVTQARNISERVQRFVGIQKGGAFDVPGETARSWLNLPNPSGANNAEVLAPFINGEDINGRNRDVWLIDFFQMKQEDAERYVVPFAYVRERIKPYRDRVRRAAHQRHWWRHADTRPAMRRACAPLSRFIATSMTAKHRFFVFVPKAVLPSNKVVVVAHDDYTTLGVLNSSVHSAWAKAVGARQGVGNDLVYNESCLSTFPWPVTNDEQQSAIAVWSKNLDQMREHLLRTDDSLTMTQIYNEVGTLRVTPDSNHRAYPLLVAQAELDASVAAAYGWEWPLTDDEILQRLLALNLERTGVA